MRTLALYFDPAYPDMDDRRFHEGDWSDFYPDAVNKLPPNMPEPCGLPIDITFVVNVDHAGNLITQQSQTGILIFVFKASIIWYSKEQNNIESSTCGSEFKALQTATDLIVLLQ